MKIYLDNCAIQRPLDSKNQLRILLEADAVLGIVELCRTQEADLVTSDLLRFEIEKCQNVVRREYAMDLLQTAKVNVRLTAGIRQRACELENFGIKSLDALHIASAEAVEADYFCTCDDGILTKAGATPLTTMKIISPVDLIKELNL